MNVLIGIGVFIGAVVVYLAVVIVSPFLKVKPIPLSGIGSAREQGPAPPNRTDVDFQVNGVRVSGWLYLPPAAEAPFPCVVLCHGFNGTKDLRLENYALRFAAAGWAAITFDYRHYGESGGEPRQLYHALRQIEDQRGAVDYVRNRKEIDPGKIVLWGTSASGLYGICTAAEDHRIAGIIAQCAALDHKEDSKEHVTRLGYGFFLRLFIHGQRCKGRSRFGLSPHMIPAYSSNGELAMISAPGVVEGISSLIEGPTNLQNEVCARSLLMPHPPNPIEAAHKVECPVLILVCEKDGIVSPFSHVKVAEALGNKAAIRTYPIGHFDIYLGGHFDKAVEAMVSFLHSL